MRLHQILGCACLAVVDGKILISNVVLLDLFSAGMDSIGQLLQSWTAILSIVPTEQLTVMHQVHITCEGMLSMNIKHD